MASEISGEEEKWVVAESELEGTPMVLRAGIHFQDLPDLRSRLPIRIGVAIPFAEGQDLSDPRLVDLEERLEPASGHRAHIVMIVSQPGFKEWMLHAGSHDWLAEFHQTLIKEFSEYEIQLVGEHDPAWSSYFELLSWLS